MAVIFSDDFEANNLDLWTVHNSNWSVQSTIKYAGTYAARGAPGTTNRVLSKTLDTAIGNCKISCRFYVDGDNAWCYPIYPLASTTAHINVMVPYTDGHWKYFTGAYHNLPIDTLVVKDTWVLVAVTFDFTNSRMGFFIDGVYKGAVTLKDSAGTTLTTDHNLTKMWLQQVGATINMYIDDFVLEDYTPPVPVNAISDSCWIV